MAAEVEISCINKTNRSNPHERISHVGGSNQDGSRWKLTLEQAIKAIEEGKYKFWTQGGGKSVWVNIALSQYGNKYLKTDADHVQPDNLLSLPECP